jgi:hypothetical protein
LFILLLKNALIGYVDYASHTYMLLLIVCFWMFRNLLAQFAPAGIFTWLIYLHILLLLTCMVFFLISQFRGSGSMADFYLPNTSIFSVWLSLVLAYLLPVVLLQMSVLKRMLPGKLIVAFFVLLLPVFLLLLYSSGRAGWLGLLAALLYTGYLSPAVQKKRKLLLTAGTFLLLFLLIAFVGLKAGSSGGRWLIYKISGGIFKDHWLLGVGTGGYKTVYNQYQSDYFSTHDINSPEAILADDTFFTFNDYWQFLLENGILLTVLVLLLLVGLIKSIVLVKAGGISKLLIQSSVASLIAVAVSSIFTYALQLLPIVMMAVLHLGLLFLYTDKMKNQCRGSRFYILTGILLPLLLCIHFLFMFLHQLKIRVAYRYVTTGAHAAAVKECENLYNTYLCDGSTRLQYARELYCTNRMTAAKQVITKTISVYPCTASYSFAADIYTAMSDYSQAEVYYRKAIFASPKLMASRLKLMQFYAEQKDTINALVWAYSIVAMPVKVTSAKTVKMKAQAGAYIKLQFQR